MIHHLPSPIIHCLLLQLKLPVPLSYGHAVGDGAIIRFALPGVNLKKGPDAFTDIAPAIRLDLAPCPVFEQSFHLRAVGGCTLRRSASGCMQQQSHMESNATLALFTLFRRKRTLLITNWDSLQRMLMALYGWVTKTFNALIKICTSRAMISFPLQNLTRANCTLLNKLGSITVVQVPQYHHGCVLGSTQRIELIMVTLAQVQK